MLVLVIFILIIVTNIETIFAIALTIEVFAISFETLFLTSKACLLFKYALYIYYWIYFWKSKGNIKVLINFGNEVNIINPAYIKKLDFHIWKIDINTQKIDGSSLTIYKIVISRFQILDELDRAYFSQKTFILANITINIILEIFFLILSNINIVFAD